MFQYLYLLVSYWPFRVYCWYLQYLNCLINLLEKTTDASLILAIYFINFSFMSLLAVYFISISCSELKPFRCFFCIYCSAHTCPNDIITYFVITIFCDSYLMVFKISPFRLTLWEFFQFNCNFLIFNNFSHHF